MSKIIGIDLGTTNSCVAAAEGGEPVVLPNSEGSRTTPSMVGFTENGERFVGQQVKRQSVINPQRSLWGIKRIIGRKFDSPEVQDFLERVPYQIVKHTNGDAWISIDGDMMSPQEIQACVLMKMKSSAEDYFGEEIAEAVITVPAYFNDPQRQATKDAGKIAGLNVLRIINEPTAAALAYGFDKAKNCRIAVFDLGGGTFDISILELQNGVFEVLATNGINNLGGEDFDRKLLDHLIEIFEDQTGLDISNDPMALQRVREASETAKCELSTISTTNISLPFLAVGQDGPMHLNLEVTRSLLNDLVTPLVERLEGPCLRALDDAGLASDELDEVLLVGGMTRMPLVQQTVKDIFKRKPHKGLNPDEVVAIGAAIQSGILGGDIEEVLLLDVTPMDLGIRLVGDRFSPLIPRNTTIPVRESKVFTTTEDNQEFVAITVLQGNSDDATQNVCLGTFTLTGIPPAKTGVPRIRVTFDINNDGIVTVSATDLKTQSAQSISITNAGGLSQSEISKAMENMS